MENASKALLMAAGVLVGVLVLALMVALFAVSNNISSSYAEIQRTEEVQQFNANFTKYLGQELTIHQVVSICNFAKEKNVTVSAGKKTEIDINDYKKDAITGEDKTQKYKIKINSYASNGYINSISFE